MLSNLLIAIGLAMDAFAVSISSGMQLKKTDIKTYITFGLYFGIFQFIMPILGYFGSVSFSEILETYSPLVSFCLLFPIGAKMLYEALKSKDETKENQKNDNDILNPKNMIMLAVATSIDAFAAGVLFQANKSDIISGSIIIGVVAFVFSAVGVYLGKKTGNLFGNKAEILGGCILILLSFKFLMS